MSEPGKAMMGTATAGSPDRANKAAEMAVACPLLEGIDLSGARRRRSLRCRCSTPCNATAPITCRC